MHSDDYSIIHPTKFDPILKQYGDKIETFSYIVPALNQDPTNLWFETKVSDTARINSFRAGVDAAQPSIMESLNEDFIDLTWRSQSALSLGEQLYSARGSQSAGFG